MREMHFVARERGRGAARKFLTGYSQVDKPGVRYKPVNFRGGYREVGEGCAEGADSLSPCHPGGNPEANGWFLKSTPIQMLPRRDSICERLI